MKQYSTITYYANLSGVNLSAFTYPKIMLMNSEIYLQITIAQFWNIGMYKQSQLYMNSNSNSKIVYLTSTSTIIQQLWQETQYYRVIQVQSGDWS